MVIVFFFFQAEDGIRDIGVTGVQTCALPIWPVKYAITPKIAAQMTVGMIASPSKPSVILTALEEPKMTKRMKISIPIPPRYTIHLALLGLTTEKSTAVSPVKPTNLM